MFTAAGVVLAVTLGVLVVVIGSCVLGGGGSFEAPERVACPREDLGARDA